MHAVLGVWAAGRRHKWRGSNVCVTLGIQLLDAFPAVLDRFWSSSWMSAISLTGSLSTVASTKSSFCPQSDPTETMGVCDAWSRNCWIKPAAQHWEPCGTKEPDPPCHGRSDWLLLQVSLRQSLYIQQTVRLRYDFPGVSVPGQLSEQPGEWAL